MVALEPQAARVRPQMSTEKKKKLTLADLVVLSLLAESPMHGYHLVHQLELRDVEDWAAISRPQVYYSLNKLVSMNLIAKAKNAEDSQGPEKTTYRINSSGKSTLTESLSRKDWAQNRSRPEFLTWMVG